MSHHIIYVDVYEFQLRARVDKLEAHWTEDLKVPGSVLGLGKYFQRYSLRVTSLFIGDIFV